MNEQEFIQVCEDAPSMAAAATELGLHFNTFARRAKKLNCYYPNQGGKGISKPSNRGFQLEDILNGKYPHYQTGKLKRKLYAAGLKKNQCEICGVSEWLNKSIECELDHINGDRTDHRLENLQIICPNCHSQTETFRGKNVKR